MKRLLFGCGWAVALAACGTTTTFAPTNPSPVRLRPKRAHEVQIYTSTTPTIPFVEIGLLQSRQSSELSSAEFPELIAGLRAEAAKIGCDGVILQGASNHNQMGLFSKNNSRVELSGFWATCIVYDPGRYPAAAPSPPPAASATPAARDANNPDASRPPWM